MADNKQAYILATASGGKALRAFKAGTSRAVPGVHVLLPPTNVAIRGSVDPQRTEDFFFTSSLHHSQFYEWMEKDGWTAALKASGSWCLGNASIDASYTRDTNKEMTANLETKTKSVVVTQCMYVPMKSFQIPRSEMILTPEVVTDALKVKTPEDAEGFLAKYNSHIYSGLYHVGGVFMREKHVMSSETVKTASLAYQGLQKLGVTLEVGHSSLSGKFEGSHTSEYRGSFKENRNASLTESEEKVRVWGATTASSKQEFLEKLEEDPSRWAVIDSAIDQPKDMVGIWEVMSMDEELKKPAECICIRWQGMVKEAAKTNAWLKELLTQSYATHPEVTA